MRLCLLFVFFAGKANKLKLPPLVESVEQVYTMTPKKIHNNKTIYAVTVVKIKSDNALSTRQQNTASNFHVLEELVDGGSIYTVVPNSMFHKELPVIKQKRQNFLKRLSTPKRCWSPL